MKIKSLDMLDYAINHRWEIYKKEGNGTKIIDYPSLLTISLGEILVLIKREELFYVPE